MKILFYCKENCGPCNMVFPKVRQLATHYKVELRKIIIDDHNKEEYKKIGIDQVPVMVFIDSKGTETTRVSGNMKSDKIEEIIKGMK